MSNLILIGPMGAGKSTSGKWLAKKLGRAFIDLDTCIEQQTGTTISNIFELEGETGFRQRESVALAEVLTHNNQVIATGGGVVLLEHNRWLMKQHGVVLYLHISPELQLRRLATDKKRPLLQTPDRAERLQTLSEIRTPIYRACADLSIDLSCMPISRIRPALLQLLTDYGFNV